MDGPAELQAFDDMWSTLIVGNPTLFTNFATFLLTAPDLLDHPTDAALFVQWSALVAPGFTLSSDNAARLADAAVALFMLAIAQHQGAPTTAHVTTPAQLAMDSEWLLLLTERAFAGQYAARPSLGRPAVIDLAWELLTRIGPPLDTLAGSGSAAANPVDILRDWVQRFPTDADARYLLGHALAAGRRASADTSAPSPDAALAAALAVLQPMVSGPATALADAAIGDAYFSAARNLPSSEPYHATTLVRSALHAYDHALALNTDPSLYAARARALQYMGRPDDAHAAASRAAALSNRAVEAEVLLATIDEARGDFSDMRNEARSAAGGSANGSLLTLDNVRFLSVDAPPYGVGGTGYSGSPGLRDYLHGDSYHSLLPHITVWYLAPPGLGAAGGFIGIQVPQTRDPKFDTERDRSLLPDQATQLAIQASVVLGDAPAADADYAAWNAAMRDERLRGGAFDQLLTRIGRMQPFDLAAHAPDEYAQAAAFATDVRRDTILRRAGRFSDDATDWEAVLPSLHGTFDHETGVEYLAEAQYLDKRYSAARDTLMAVYGQEVNGHASADYFQDLIATDLHLGRYADASGLVTIAASVAGMPDDVTAEQQGEIALLQRRASTAVSNFSRAVSDFSAGESEAPTPYHVNANDYVLEQSNVGTALLLSLQATPDTAPDCSAHAFTCRDAATAYRAALTIDPDNAVILMNLGWTERLLDDDTAERASLERAVASDPMLFPALNDLGVLYAQSGDAIRAATMFVQAIAANPNYDLATWNLGVLEMEDITKLPRAQALLAKAAQLNPNLRGTGLDFRTDERIYTVAFQRGAAPPFTSAYSIGVVVLGSTGLVSLLLLVLFEFSKERGWEYAVNRLERMRGRWLTLWASMPAMLRSSVGALPTTVIALLLGTVIVTVWANSADRLSLALIAMFSAVLGIVVHEAGHVVAARLLKRGVVVATAPGGIAVAVLMIPFRLIGGPYFGHRVVSEPSAAATDDTVAGAARGRNLVVYLAGPVANALVLATCAVVFLFQPVPALKFVLLVQLGIITFSMLPLKPMEGATLTEEHPWLVGIALFALVVVGVVFAQGVL